ncbi:hypothetical protein Pdw03_0885 [Penicillium digitatum]|uniref:Uncharacterized protein n=1 Tax=Penicillium digitatum TaxID=36651 RepID=A0A7T6XRL9_PENDI|nr:hypothetical protein Pdw03_0885 [Penicillium digitatum]
MIIVKPPSTKTDTTLNLFQEPESNLDKKDLRCYMAPMHVARTAPWSTPVCSVPGTPSRDCPLRCVRALFLRVARARESSKKGN